VRRPLPDEGDHRVRSRHWTTRTIGQLPSRWRTPRPSRSATLCNVVSAQRRERRSGQRSHGDRSPHGRYAESATRTSVADRGDRRPLGRRLADRGVGLTTLDQVLKASSSREPTTRTMYSDPSAQLSPVVAMIPVRLVPAIGRSRSSHEDLPHRRTIHLVPLSYPST